MVIRVLEMDYYLINGKSLSLSWLLIYWKLWKKKGLIDKCSDYLETWDKKGKSLICILNTLLNKQEFLNISNIFIL